MAMVRDVFAIAGWARNRHTEQAFQASSPKTSTTRPSGRVFFAHLARGDSHPGHRIAAMVRVWRKCRGRARQDHGDKAKLCCPRAIAVQRETGRGGYSRESVIWSMSVFRIKISALANGFAIPADINVISHLHNRPM
jgi:hypothetical protein